MKAAAILFVITDAGFASFLDNAHTIACGVAAGWLAYITSSR